MEKIGYVTIFLVTALFLFSAMVYAQDIHGTRESAACSAATSKR